MFGNNMFSKFQHYFVVFLLVPGVFIFQLTIIHPNLFAVIRASIVKQLTHYCLLSFCFINVVGNMTLSMIKDSTLKKPVFGEGTYCEHCRMLRPARSWHCMKCNACIMKRDHHCTFLARCIGLYNLRPYILFLGHVTLSMLYITWFNYHYITLRYDEDVLIHAVICFINPMLRLLMPKAIDIVDMCVLYCFFNLVVTLVSGSLFFFHLRNVLLDVTSYESRFPSPMDVSKWKEHLLNVFGTTWYLAILCPLSQNALQKDDTTQSFLKNL